MVKDRVEPVPMLLGTTNLTCRISFPFNVWKSDLESSKKKEKKQTKENINIDLQKQM